MSLHFSWPSLSTRSISRRTGSASASRTSASWISRINIERRTFTIYSHSSIFAYARSVNPLEGDVSLYPCNLLDNPSPTLIYHIHNLKGRKMGRSLLRKNRLWYPLRIMLMLHCVCNSLLLDGMERYGVSHSLCCTTNV